MMTDGKYKYNPETLEFESSDRTKKQKLLINLLSIFVGAVIIAITIFFIYVLFFDINIKKQKARENKILTEQYNLLLERKKQNDKYLKELIKKDEIIYQSVFKSLPDNSIFENKNPYTKFSRTDTKSIIDTNKIRIKRNFKIAENTKKEYDYLTKLIQKEDIDNVPAIQPVFNPFLKYPVYGFGKRIDQVYKSLVFHPGIDFAVPEGTAVFSAANGKVIKSGRKRGLGKRVVIDHQNGYKTIYAHLDKIFVKTGYKVKRGEKIGTAGMTGKTLIPHLHYEIQYNNKPVNPVHYFFLDLSPEKYTKIMTDSERSGLSLD